MGMPRSFSKWIEDQRRYYIEEGVGIFSNLREAALLLCSTAKVGWSLTGMDGFKKQTTSTLSFPPSVEYPDLPHTVPERTGI